jgi:hypothetical protein
MSDEPEAARPTLGSDASAARDATEVAVRLVEELQAGLDEHDADAYNRHFADDVLWGSRFGATVHSYEQLHAIHVRLLQQRRGGPSRYEIERVLAPHPRTSPSHTSAASRSIEMAAHSSRAPTSRALSRRWRSTCWSDATGRGGWPPGRTRPSAGRRLTPSDADPHPGRRPGLTVTPSGDLRAL